MRAHEILSEISYKDIYPKAFDEFRQKYLALDPEARADLYVQFTNYADNTLDKNAFHSPDHHDPVGVYGYPLDYVLDHPTDVWYGQRAKYLRVIRSKAQNLLRLQGMTEEQALEALARVTMKERGYRWNNFPHSLQEFWKLALDRVKPKRDPNRYARAFMLIIQYRLQYNRKLEPFQGTEQTKRLLAAGFDAVLDAAQDEFSAIINDREPEQIIFLKRSAFDMVDVVALRPDAKATDKLTHYDSADSFRKLAALICAQIGDRLDAQSKTDVLYTDFHTKGGLNIALRADFARMGSSSIKPHRGADTDTKEDIMVKVTGQYGDYERTFASAMSFQEVAQQVGADLKQMIANGPQEGSQAQRYWDKVAPKVEPVVDAWEKLARHYGIAWPSVDQLSPKVKVMIYEMTKIVDKALHPTWVRYRRPKPDLVFQQVEAFWAQQRKPAAFLGSVRALLVKIAKDKKLEAGEISNIRGVARALGLT